MKRAERKYVATLLHKLIVPVFAITICILPIITIGQEDSTKKEEITQQEENEKVSPAIELVSIQKSDNTIDLKASLRAKIKGTLTKLSGLKVEFFQTGDTEDLKLGETISGSNGIALINIKSEGITADKEGKLNFKVVIAGNSTFETAEEVIAIKRAKLILTPVKEDSALSVQLNLVDISSGTEATIPETNLSVYVKRMFSALKLGEGATDENGEATIEISNTLPGDEKGNITLIARLEDNEVYGNLETAVVQNWGVAVSNESKNLPRALWSPDPPIWMLITFIVLMTLVWGHYLVIIYELFRLRKEHT